MADSVGQKIDFGAIWDRKGHAGFWRRFFAFTCDIGILTASAQLAIYMLSLTAVGPVSLSSGLRLVSVERTISGSTTDERGREVFLSLIRESEGVLPILAPETLTLRVARQPGEKGLTFVYPYYPDRYDFYMARIDTGERLRVSVSSEEELMSFLQGIDFSGSLFDAEDRESATRSGLISLVPPSGERLSFSDLRLIGKTAERSVPADRSAEKPFLLAVFLYFVLMERLSVHGSLGKRFLKIKTVQGYQEKLTWFTAVARTILKALSILSLGIGVLTIVFIKRRQGLHDMILGTYVLRSPPPQDSSFRLGPKPGGRPKGSRNHITDIQ